MKQEMARPAAKNKTVGGPPEMGPVGMPDGGRENNIKKAEAETR